MDLILFYKKQYNIKNTETEIVAFTTNVQIYHISAQYNLNYTGPPEKAKYGFRYILIW